MSKPFAERLREQQTAQNSLVCVGLDTDIRELPECVRSEWPHDRMLLFNQAIIDACAPHCSVFKPNFAFYLGVYSDSTLGPLVGTVRYIRENWPNHVIILDAKWGEVMNTAERQAAFTFDFLGVDAVTLWPGTGSQSLRSFFDKPERGAIVVCRTSNPGAQELQDAPVYTGVMNSAGQPITDPYWLWLGKRVTRWTDHGNIGLVMGATYPGELRLMREAIGDSAYFLNPGIGKQAQEAGLANPVQAAVEAGQDSLGAGMVINSSRGIIFASKGKDYATMAARETERLRDEINRFRHQPAA